MKRKRPPRIQKGFRKLIEKKINEYRDYTPKKRWDALVGEAQDYFIGRLGLSKKREERVKQLEAHTLLLLVANSKVKDGEALTMKMVRTIFEKMQEEIPIILRAHKKRLSKKHLEQLEHLQKITNQGLQRLKNVPENYLVEKIQTHVLNRAKEIHTNVIALALLDKFSLYQRTLNRAITAIGAALGKKGL